MLFANITAMLRSVTLFVLLAIMLAGGGPFMAERAHASAFNDPATGGEGGSGDGFAAVEDEVDGGSVTIGSSAEVVVQFRNEGNQDITAGDIQLYPSSTVSTSISLNQCKGEPIPSGAKCAIVISVNGLKSGDWRVEMLMNHSGRSRLVTATMTGSVEQAGDGEDTTVSDIEAVPSEVEFGSLSSSQPLVRSVTLRNVTSEAIDVTDIYIQAAKQSGYSLKTNCSRLRSGQACLATITWAPNQKGLADAVMTVEHSGPTAVTTVQLSGEFSPDSSETAAQFPEAVPGEGLLVASKEEIDFGSGVKNESAISVSLVNVGDAELELKDISLAGSNNGLAIARGGCQEGTVIKPVQACPLTINWAPVRKGSIVDDLQVAHTGARGHLLLPVRGSAAKAFSKDTDSILSIDGRQKTIINKSQALEGFNVTSHSMSSAVIKGPGGSRVVSDGQEVVIGGAAWRVNMVESGVEFISGEDSVKLLFDQSLSSAGGGSENESGGDTSDGGGAGGGDDSSS